MYYVFFNNKRLGGHFEDSISNVMEKIKESKIKIIYIIFLYNTMEIQFFYSPSSHHFPLFVSSLLNAYFCKSAKVSIIKPKINTQQPIVSKVVIVLGAPALMEL